MSEIIEVICEG